MKLAVLTWRRTAAWLCAGLVCTVALGCWAMTTGSTSISMSQLWGALWGTDPKSIHHTILWSVRLPRALFAVFVGAGLSLGGVAFQALLRNPLADPYILGISGGAALGATLALTSGSVLAVAAAVAPATAAMVGAVVALVPLFVMTRTSGGRLNAFVLLLSGVMFNAFASSVITLHKAIVSAQKAQELLFFLMGSLDVEHLPWTTLALCASVVTAAVGAIWWVSQDLNIMNLGDDDARALGVRVGAVRWWVILWASAAVAVCVAFTGLIGFVGLVVPHALRLTLGPDHRLLVPASALAGASALIVCDALARQSFGLFSTTLPVGVITALVGAPMFMVLLWRSTRQGGL